MGHFYSKPEIISPIRPIREKIVNYLIRSTCEVIGDTGLPWEESHGKLYSSMCDSFAYSRDALVRND